MPKKNYRLENAVEKTRNSLRSDRLDMSFGEIINLYEDKELDIAPEYQRLFRWDKEQQTEFIESLILNIPIPPIFVAEDTDTGKWEIVDGVQRISTVLSFFDKLPGKTKLTLMESSLIPELKGINIQNIPLKLSNTLKRATCRVEILRWDSSTDMRFELFRRLNTTASPLSEQEIRNCIFRSSGNNFNQLLKELANERTFTKLTKLSDTAKKVMFGEELILRFFCFQHNYHVKISSLPDFLTKFMELVTKREIDFDISRNKTKFQQVVQNISFDAISNRGKLSLRLWDAITYATAKYGKLEQSKIDQIKNEIVEANLNKTSGKDRPKKAIEIAEQIALSK